MRQRHHYQNRQIQLAHSTWSIHEWLSPSENPTTIIALHGFTGSGLDFEALIGRVNPEISWICPDLPGHGGTIGLRSIECYRFNSIVDAVSEISTTASPQTPPVLMGYSMGGRAALHCALNKTARFSGLILVSANPGIEDSVLRLQRKQKDEDLAAQIRTEGTEWFAHFWEQQAIISTQRNIPLPFGSQLRERRRKQSATELARSLNATGQGSIIPLWQTLYQICIPALVIAGANDKNYQSIAQRVEKQMPDAVCKIVANAGHCAHLENLETSSALINQFLQKSIHLEKSNGCDPLKSL